MAKRNWDEKLSDLSVKLADLSQKAAVASEDARVARELRDEVMAEKIENAKCDVATLEENIRIAEEEGKSKFTSAMLKTKMTVKAKIQDHRAAKDKKLMERYIEDQVYYILDCYDAAALLIANAELAILETLEAAEEYEKRYGAKEEEEPAAEEEPKE